jgi:hypothetical protein
MGVCHASTPSAIPAGISGGKHMDPDAQIRLQSPTPPVGPGEFGFQSEKEFVCIDLEPPSLQQRRDRY